MRDRTPRSSIAISSPGSTSRTKVAPTMSRAAVSLATTQPRASRPSTSGRKPCGSRAAYSVRSSMNTSEKAPRTSGSVAMAPASTLPSGIARRRGEQRGQHAGVGGGPGLRAVPGLPGQRGQFPGVDQVAVVAQGQAGRVGVDRNVGWAFSHTEEPLVEYRQCPTVMCPRSVFRTDSLKTCGTRPMSL